ncbi:hypothetical protein SODALDRAFT_377615, partial [Sodiomyces alkalinus F11]
MGLFRANDQTQKLRRRQWSVELQPREDGWLGQATDCMVADAIHQSSQVFLSGEPQCLARPTGDARETISPINGTLPPSSNANDESHFRFSHPPVVAVVQTRQSGTILPILARSAAWGYEYKSNGSYLVGSSVWPWFRDCVEYVVRWPDASLGGLVIPRNGASARPVPNNDQLSPVPPGFLLVAHFNHRCIKTASCVSESPLSAASELVSLASTLKSWLTAKFKGSPASGDTPGISTLYNGKYESPVGMEAFGLQAVAAIDYFVQGGEDQGLCVNSSSLLDSVKKRVFRDKAIDWCLIERQNVYGGEGAYLDKKGIDQERQSKLYDRGLFRDPCFVRNRILMSWFGLFRVDETCGPDSLVGRKPAEFHRFIPCAPASTHQQQDLSMCLYSAVDPYDVLHCTALYPDQAQDDAVAYLIMAWAGMSGWDAVFRRLILRDVARANMYVESEKKMEKMRTIRRSGDVYNGVEEVDNVVLIAMAIAVTPDGRWDAPTPTSLSLYQKYQKETSSSPSTAPTLRHLAGGVKDQDSGHANHRAQVHHLQTLKTHFPTSESHGVDTSRECTTIAEPFSLSPPRSRAGRPARNHDPSSTGLCDTFIQTRHDELPCPSRNRGNIAATIDQGQTTRPVEDETRQDLGATRPSDTEHTSRSPYVRSGTGQRRLLQGLFVLLRYVADFPLNQDRTGTGSTPARANPIFPPSRLAESVLSPHNLASQDNTGDVSLVGHVLFRHDSFSEFRPEQRAVTQKSHYLPFGFVKLASKWTCVYPQSTLSVLPPTTYLTFLPSCISHIHRPISATEKPETSKEELGRRGRAELPRGERKRRQEEEKTTSPFQRPHPTSPRVVFAPPPCLFNFVAASHPTIPHCRRECPLSHRAGPVFFVLTVLSSHQALSSNFATLHTARIPPNFPFFLTATTPSSGSSPNYQERVTGIVTFSSKRLGLLPYLSRPLLCDAPDSANESGREAARTYPASGSNTVFGEKREGNGLSPEVFSPRFGQPFLCCPFHTSHRPYHCPLFAAIWLRLGGTTRTTTTTTGTEVEAISRSGGAPSASLPSRTGPPRMHAHPTRASSHTRMHLLGFRANNVSSRLVSSRHALSLLFLLLPPPSVYPPFHLPRFVSCSLHASSALERRQTILFFTGACHVLKPAGLLAVLVILAILLVALGPPRFGDVSCLVPHYTGATGGNQMLCSSRVPTCESLQPQQPTSRVTSHVESLASLIQVGRPSTLYANLASSCYASAICSLPSTALADLAPNLWPNLLQPTLIGFLIDPRRFPSFNGDSGFDLQGVDLDPLQTPRFLLPHTVSWQA